MWLERQKVGAHTLEEDRQNRTGSRRAAELTGQGL